MLLRIGLISDTHGLLRPQALAFLRGCDHIVHGGDITGPEVLDALAALAPVTAVRGNNDRGAWAGPLHETGFVTFGEVRIGVVHDLARPAVDWHAHGVRVVVSGLSHTPALAERDGVLFVTPGSAGPRRFKLPVTVAELVIDGHAVTARIVPLDVDTR